MRNSRCFFIIGIVLFLVYIPNAFAAKSGDISYASPNPLNCEGSPENVTVRIVNTGDDGDLIIEPDSIPFGWNVSPPSIEVFLPSGSVYYATFSVTPSYYSSSGTIVWKLYYSDWWCSWDWCRILLDTYYQSVVNHQFPHIDYITNPAQPPDQTVHFEGTSGLGTVQWEWWSNLDGILSTAEDFNKSSYEMTVGSHIIEFRVRYSDSAIWYGPDTASLIINNALPTALPPIDLPGGLVPCGSTICIELPGYDNDENGHTIIERELRLDEIDGIDGIIYHPTSEWFCFPAPSAPGDYQLRYRVRDDEGSWSSYVTNNLLVVCPVGEIVYVSPDPLFCEGSSENVTVRIRNTGSSSGEMIIEPDSIPPGWNVSPAFRAQYMPPGSEYSIPFTVIPPPYNDAGTIVWKLYDTSHSTPLDTYNQTVFNTMPVQIDSVTPNPAQPPSQMIQFRGTGGNYSTQWISPPFYS